MTRRGNLFVRGWALAAAFAIAFMQLALSAYACPMGAVDAPATVHAAPAIEMPGEACDPADMGAPPLCAKSCQPEPQKHDTDTLAALPPSLDAGLRVDRPRLGIPRLSATVDSLLARATSPPLAILYARFLK